eukprot:TRINITY_DN64817_c0_g1_i1.p1 TRINITY_DN64817_c0_g1~~TRINITY_DN64817_c0_g1_i1.p1  ORF type:complete len:904 (+),score=85.40 TRINITY_DN64817_c0_g1_i1:89-2800(+)
MAHTHPLEGDGIQVNLFHYLWKKGQGLEDKKLKFKIPDTIVFYNFPIVWYYWSETSQEIRKKGGKELERQHIRQAFCKHKESPDVCDIVASFLSHKQDEEDKIVFFNEAELAEFLEGKPTQQGLLQKFILPRGNYNEMVQAIWSPGFTLVNKRVNRHKLNDRHCPRTQKAITYEGATHYTEEAMCAPAVRKRVDEVCVSFVEHFKSVEHHYSISRMVMYFKEDRRNNDKMWLMFSSSFRINEQKFQQKKTPVSLTPQFKGLYNDMDLQNAKKKSKRPTSAPAKRFRQGYLKNVRMEDMEALAQAALNAGLAEEDDGVELGLRPIATMPLPTSLQQAVMKPQDMKNTTTTQNAVTAPNDTIKSEMLLERIYFNKRAKQIKDDIQKWGREADKIVEDLAVIRKHKEAFRLGLISPEQSRKRVRNLPQLPDVSPSFGASQFRKKGSKSKKEKADSINDTATADGSPTMADRENSIMSADKLQHAGSGAPPISLTGFAIGDEIAARASMSSGISTTGSDVTTQSQRVRKLEESRNSKKSKDKDYDSGSDIDKQDKNKQKRLQDALSMLTGETKDSRRAQRTKLREKKVKESEKPVYNSEQNVEEVMKHVLPSLTAYFKQIKSHRLELADMLDDSIYNCYSELALQHKTASYYCFCLSKELADIVETNFRANLEALRIKRYDDFLHNKELELRRKVAEDVKQPALPHRLAQLRGVKENVRALPKSPSPMQMQPPTSAGGFSSFSATSSGPGSLEGSRPNTSQGVGGIQISEAHLGTLDFGGVGPKTRPDTSQTTCSIPPVLLGGGMADVQDDSVVIFTITKQERSTVNEFNRFLSKVRAFMIDSADLEVQRLAGLYRERQRDMRWVNLLETIKNHPLAHQHVRGNFPLSSSRTDESRSIMTTSSFSEG